MKGELIHTKIPELGLGRGMMERLFAILVPAIIPKPDVVALVDEREGKTALFLCQTYPNLAVHHQAVVEVDDLFPHAAFAAVVCIYPLILLASTISQTVQTQQISISRLYNMFLRSVPEELAQLDKVLRVRDGTAHILLAVARSSRVGRGKRVEGIAGDAVEESNDGGWEEEGNRTNDALEEQQQE